VKNARTLRASADRCTDRAETTDDPVLKRQLQMLAEGFKAVAENQQWLEGAPLEKAAPQTR
jgi:hypothetical protein